VGRDEDERLKEQIKNISISEVWREMKMIT